jgi:multiple sugar transport system substrate-binding protein
MKTESIMNARNAGMLMVSVSLLLGACGAPAAPAAPAATEAPAKAAPAATEAPAKAAPATGGKILFLSTQANNVNESEALRKQVLAGSAVEVELVTSAGGPFVDKLQAESQAGKGTVDVAAGLVGDLSPLSSKLSDLSSLKGKIQGIPDNYWEVGKLGTDKQLMVPWMQASLIMAVNKKALKYLPAGADVNTLTYDQLQAWGQAMMDGEKEAKIGFAAGKDGLIHRFFQGYLIPAFSGGTAATFGTADAAAGWKYFAGLWKVVNPQSTTYNFMQEQLLSEEVWVTIDHVARLKNAFNEKPDAFVAAPAPIGPKGRAYMVILAGMSVPATAPNADSAKSFIEYMTKADTQAKTLNAIGFYPVAGSVPADAPAWQTQMSGAIKAQASDPKALAVLIPQGLGAKGGDFNKVYRDTFTEIVLNGGDIAKTLETQKSNLQKVLTDAKAACWAPDPVKADQPCVVN